MNVRAHPAYRRKRIWPLLIHYTVIPPRVTSIAFHVGEFTHNFYTGRNTLSAHDLGNVTWGHERGRQEARRRGHHLISVLLGVITLAFLAVIVVAVVVGMALLHAVVR